MGPEPRAPQSTHAAPGPVRFRDPELDLSFRRDGFVKVPFLDTSALDQLRALWDEVAPAHIEGIYSNVHDLDPATNRRIDRAITQLFTAPAHRLFDGAVLGGSSFLVKGAGSNSASTPHQDWNNVEEERTESLSVWVPLVDVDEHNGALQVIPGSHHARPSIRSLDTPSLYLDFTDRLEPYLRCVPARAGDAIVYAHNLFHGSKENRSDRVRVSATSGVVPHGARLVHYRSVPGAPDEFEVLEVERDFYFSGISDMKAGRIPPTARRVGRVRVPAHELSFEDVVRVALTDRDPDAHAGKEHR